MLKTYILAARLVSEQGLKLLAAKYSWAAWLGLGGPFGVILSFILSPFIGFLATEGMLKIEFIRIDYNVYKDAARYKSAIDKLEGINKSDSPLTPEEKAQIILEVKKATKEFISIAKYIKQSGQ